MAHNTRRILDLLRWLTESVWSAKQAYQANKRDKRRQVRSLIRRRLLSVQLSLLFVLSALGGGILSCGSDTTTGPPPLSASQTYWTLRLNQRAVNMATVSPYNTIQLTATALNVDGVPLGGVGPVTYTAKDTTVTVSPTGLVTAHYRTPSTTVTARLQVQNMTLTELVTIQITDTVPQHPLATFSMQPAQGDSAKRSLDIGLLNWPVHATNAVGATLCDTTQCALNVDYASSNIRVARGQVPAGHWGLSDTGHVVLTATTWAYGVAMRDSVVLTVGHELKYTVSLTIAVLFGVLTLGFMAPRKLILGVGAVVTFCNHSTHPVDIIFDQPAAVDSASCGTSVGGFFPPTGNGNIPAFGGIVSVDSLGDSTAAPDPGNVACRRFSLPGTYHYHSSLFPSDTYEIQIQRD